MEKNLFAYLQYWNVIAHIHKRYSKEFTKKQCQIIKSNFEKGLKYYSKKELKILSYEIHKTRSNLDFSLEELNKKYRDKLRKERGFLAYLILSILDSLFAFLRKIFNI